jgi:myo-inositol 2-dehydrogenase / D-chiro-inositol 1-dehydrogenase
VDRPRRPDSGGASALSGLEQPLRLGIIGTGFIGQVHADCAARSGDVSLVAVAGVRGRARPDRIRLAETVRRSTVAELLSAEDVDAVLVCSRTADHVEHAVSVLQAGKHLLLEKPGGISVEAQRRIREAAAAHPQLQLRVAYHRRHDRRFQELARLIAAGAIGRPFAVQLESRENFPPSWDDGAAGGFIMDVGVHDFDTARWLLGSNPQSVATTTQRAVYRDADLDNAYITITLEDAVAAIHLARTNRVGMDIRCEVLGESGSIVFDTTGRTGQITILGATAETAFAADCRDFFADAYSRQIDDFAAACRGGASRGATLEDDRWAVATAVAARSDAALRGPVEIGRDWAWPEP